MKKIFFILLFFQIGHLFSQELISTIITKEGTEFFVCVTEVTQKEVKFRKNCIDSDPIEAISLLRVFMIIDPNGGRSYYKSGHLSAIQDRPLDIVVRCNEEKGSQQANPSSNSANTSNNPSKNSAPASSTNLSFIDNETLIKLKTTGKSDSEIMDLIRNTPHKFETSVDQIKHLAASGISSELIRFIMSN